MTNFNKKHSQKLSLLLDINAFFHFYIIIMANQDFNIRKNPHIKRKSIQIRLMR